MTALFAGALVFFGAVDFRAEPFELALLDTALLSEAPLDTALLVDTAGPLDAALDFAAAPLRALLFARALPFEFTEALVAVTADDFAAAGFVCAGFATADFPTTAFPAAFAPLPDEVLAALFLAALALVLAALGGGLAADCFTTDLLVLGGVTVLVVRRAAILVLLVAQPGRANTPPIRLYRMSHA